MLKWAGYALLFLSLFAYLNRWLVIAEYVVTFRPILFWLSALFLMLNLHDKRRTVMPLVLALAALLNLLEIQPYLHRRQRPDKTADLSILFYNVDRNYLPHVGIDAVVKMVEETNADVVILREVGEVESAEIQRRAAYAHSLTHHDVPTDGVLILSRIPLRNPHVKSLGMGRKTALVDLQINDRSLHLITSHPTNPNYDFAERNSQLAAIADYVRRAPDPLVVVGDLNVTMWSHWHKQLEAAGTQNMRRGRGIMPTWEPLPFLSVPIDHVLTGEGVQVVTAGVLAGRGSDHRPIFVTLALD